MLWVLELLRLGICYCIRSKRSLARCYVMMYAKQIAREFAMFRQYEPRDLMRDIGLHASTRGNCSQLRRSG